MKELLIKFLEWMNEINSKEPMKLETDNEDIAMMFLVESKSCKTCKHNNPKTTYWCMACKYDTKSDDNNEAKL